MEGRGNELVILIMETLFVYLDLELNIGISRSRSKREDG
jgi:hypothetical protein